MKFKLFILFVLISVNSLLNSTTWLVKQDGTGNFITIQEALDAPETSTGDSIVVYPGIYYENLEIDSGENAIWLCSRFAQTGDESYIHNTIIDGNQNGSTVLIDNTLLFRMMGFTIQNGSGTPRYENGPLCGGGIYSKDNNSCLIYKCVIKDNKAFDGGGLYVNEGEITLFSNNITANHANRLGGGFCLADNAEINFDEDYPCNIYLNYAAMGCEFAKFPDCPPLTIYMDTFTVINPNRYYFFDRDQSGVPLNDITMHIQNGLFEPVSADLYVSPDGNNNNSGLSVDEPLQSINLAYSMIESDSLQPHTIHLSDGVYSPSLNNQRFPIQTHGFVSLVGESMENTILDAENNSAGILHQKYDAFNLTIENFTMMRVERQDYGNYGTCYFNTFFENNYFVNLNNITFTESYRISAIRIYKVETEMNNILIYNNNSSGILWDSTDLSQSKKCVIKNCKIYDNYSDPDGSCRMIHVGDYITGPLLNQVDIINTEITGNVSNYSDWPRSAVAISISEPKIVNIVNSTIGNNDSPTGGCALKAYEGPSVRIYNSIMYGDTNREIYLENTSSSPCSLIVYNSLIEGGEFSVGLIGNHFLDWDEETTLDENPYWDVDGDYPFALMVNSPCINAGTLDLPAGIELPEFDLAGYPRIYGETIDMGAYEFQGDPQSNDENEIVIPQVTQISNYPNPFNPSTTIKLDLAESGKIELAIFNIKGQKVKTLMDAYSAEGHFEIIWRGIDNNGNKVSSGQYFIKLKVNGKEKAVRKCILLK